MVGFKIQVWPALGFTLTIRDGDLSTASYKNYEDNSGVYILDIFVIDPKQEEGFNNFGIPLQSQFSDLT